MREPESMDDGRRWTNPENGREYRVFMLEPDPFPVVNVKNMNEPLPPLSRSSGRKAVRFYHPDGRQSRGCLARPGITELSQLSDADLLALFNNEK